MENLNSKPELRVAKIADAKAQKKFTAMDALRRQFENPVKIEPKCPSFIKDQLRNFASNADIFPEAKYLNWSFVKVLKPLFEPNNKYDPHTRLPEEPLLLVDRITGIDVIPGSMGKGIIWTETDVTENAWYLHDIYMPGGIMIESGLCDLILISYLEIDFLPNKGEREYRLLGCDLMFYGAPPKVGDILCYQIHLDGHANIGDQQIFFFHYDCRVNNELRLSVRNGQAAFVTPQAAGNAKGVIWEPETGGHKSLEESVVAPPEVVCTRNQFSKDQVKAFSEGRAYECFGDGFEILASHTKTPSISSGMMCLLHAVTCFDPRGGPWGRGYIRVENKISPDDWFLTGHFKNDSCMPETLMVEACMQTLAFYLTAMGFTITRDGWRFEPVPNEVYKVKCRSQVTPSSRCIRYEAFIEEVILVDGRFPTVFADLVATCDGRKSLHIRRLGICIVPDSPLGYFPYPLANHTEKKPSAIKHGFEFDYKSIKIVSGEFDPSRKPETNDMKKTLRLIKRDNNSSNCEGMESLARDIGVPVSMVTVSDDGQTAFSKNMPLNRFPVSIDKASGKSVVSLQNTCLDMDKILTYGRNLIGYEPWLGEDLCRGLCKTFVNRVILDDPYEFAAVRGNNVIYLANHQVQIESMLFPGLAQVLTDNRMVAIANADHRKGWMGPLNELLYSYPEVNYPKNIVYFDQGDRASMFTILDNFKKMITEEGISVFLHVEGKLGFRCRQPVKTLSSVFIDLAINLNLPIIPVRFFGGLPVEEMESTIDFPYGYCKQDYYLGKPIFPDELIAMPYAERRKYAMNAINALGPPLEDEVPNPSNLVLKNVVQTWQKKTGTSEYRAVIFNVLKNIENPSESTVKFLHAVNGQDHQRDDSKSRWIKKFKEWINQKE
ncbi:MAG: hypothetical protein KJ737_17785 [Proteobacteria bacterium]|nr:hypothetical protein [Pseudomonadota bacterium]